MASATAENTAVELPATLSVGDVAELLNVTPWTIRAWLKAGQLPAPLRIARTIRWKRETIARLLEAGE